jgi:hypothetical protein
MSHRSIGPTPTDLQLHSAVLSVDSGRTDVSPGTSKGQRLLLLLLCIVYCSRVTRFITPPFRGRKLSTGGSKKETTCFLLTSDQFNKFYPDVLAKYRSMLTSVLVCSCMQRQMPPCGKEGPACLLLHLCTHAAYQREIRS